MQVEPSGVDPKGLAGEDLPVSPLLDGAFFDGARLSDSFLVAKAREGSTDAFEVLVVRHRDRAFRLALRLTGNHSAAEDVTQEALVSAWRGLGSFRGEAEFTTWLHRIVVNAANQQRPKHRHMAELSGQEEVDESLGPDLVVEAKMHAGAMHAAILELPFDLRAPLVLYQFEGFSYDESAAILKVQVDTVRGRIFRARRRLVAAMREWR